MPSRLSAIIALTLFSFVNLSWAGNGPIPIKANENTTISIFFPSRIIKVVEPAAHFLFQYDAEGKLATLRAERGNPSNLTVITDTGDIYSFALDYSETIQEYTFVITPEQAIGRKKGMLVQSTSLHEDASQSGIVHSAVEGRDRDTDYSSISDNTSEPSSDNSSYLADEAGSQTSDTGASGLSGGHVSEASYRETQHSGASFQNTSEENSNEEMSFFDMDRECYYQIFCENSLLQRSITKKNMSANSGVDLRLNHLAVDHNEIYFTLQFRNVSKSDYRIAGVRFYIKSPGSDELPMTPLYVYNLETYVKQSGVNKSVHVFKDFILGSDQDIYAVMEEKDGHRHLVLPLNFSKRLEDLED